MKTIKHIIFFLISFMYCSGTLSGQTQLEHKKTTFYDAEGNLYWNKELPAYIWVSPSPDSEKLLLKSKEHAKYVNPCYFDTEGPNFIRTRWAVDKDTKKTVHPQVEIKFPVIVDGVPPSSELEIEQTSHYKKNKNDFYGSIQDIKIKSYDKYAGIKNIYYSINNQPYKKYIENLQVDKEGDVVLKYYAVDNVGNVEVPKQKVFSLDKTAPETFHTVVGIALKGNIISLGTKIYLESKDNMIGVKATYLKYDDGNYKLYNGKTLPLKQLENGQHTLTYYSIDKVGNTEKPKKFDFYLDKLAPILTSDVLGDRYIVKDQIYFSGRTKLKLTAVDNKSGVKEKMYSIDGSKFKKYDQPFYLPSVKGIHIIKYFAVDNLDNNSSGNSKHKYEQYKHKIEKIYVDLVGPTINHSYLGNIFHARDTVFINENTKIKLTATDKESGLQYISYSIDGVQEETKYTKPFPIKKDSMNVKSGVHILEYFGYDNVNNRNRGQIFFYVDNEGPVPSYSYSIKPIDKKAGLDVYPSYVIVYLSATDATIGTKDIYYSINGVKEQLYSKLIKGFKSNQINTIKIRAIDKLKNETVKEFKFYVE